MRARATRWLAALSLALALTFTLAACGGGGTDESLLEGLQFDLSEFESVEEPELESDGGEEEVLSAFFGIGNLDLEQGYRVAYLHDMLSLVEEATESNRDLQQLGEAGGSGGGVDVEWLISVHDSHFVSEELRFRIYSYPFTEGLAIDYVDFHADFLRGVEIYTICADRLLESALMLDPEYGSGNLTPAENAEFLSLARESMFYCQQSGVMITRSGEGLQEQISNVRFN